MATAYGFESSIEEKYKNKILNIKMPVKIQEVNCSHRRLNSGVRVEFEDSEGVNFSLYLSRDKVTIYGVPKNNYKGYSVYIRISEKGSGFQSGDKLVLLPFRGTERKTVIKILKDWIEHNPSHQNEQKLYLLHHYLPEPEHTHYVVLLLIACLEQDFLPN
jgi:hypothetical protein